MGPNESHEKKVFRKNPNMGLQAILISLGTKRFWLLNPANGGLQNLLDFILSLVRDPGVYL